MVDGDVPDGRGGGQEGGTAHGALAIVDHRPVGVNGYYKLILLLDKRYNCLALIGRELLSFIACTIRKGVCNNRSPLVKGFMIQF